MKRLMAHILVWILLISVVAVPVRVMAAPTERVSPPVVTNVTATTITVKAMEGYEYGMSVHYWRTSNVFTRLAPDVEYTIYQRKIDQPDTVSEPVKVRTLSRTDGTVPAVAPQVEQCTHDSVTLVRQEGYEYRVNGGAWKDRFFENLQPDTEYVFEQRVRLNSEELGGPISEPLVVRTSIEGPSSRVNHLKVVEALQECDVVNEYGEKGIAVTVQDEEGGQYYFILYVNTRNSGEFPAMQLLYDGSNVNGLVMDMSILLHPRIKDIHANYTTYLVDGDTLVERVHCSVPITKGEYCAAYHFETDDYGTYLSNELLTELGSVGLEMLCAVWDEALYQGLGFGLKGMGFTSYEGMGKAVCDSSAGYHLGTLETRFAREAGCVTDGNTGVKYCTLCGEIADAGKTIKAKGTHTYDSECDIDCNDCGQFRWTRHSYNHSCDMVCDVCGYTRVNPLSLHSGIVDGVCLDCGEAARYLGDVSGDGKVNIADVSKLYGHIRVTAVLTDPLDLYAADQDRNGKINIADVSKLYAMVRGTK